MGESGSVLDGVIIHGEPLVSVCVITYNHGKYIRQCLDGILMQKVNFPYEVLIHDDASPDDTADIIREYEAKYPEVIKPIYQTVNQYSQGVSVHKWNIDRALGKYIAQCEGDDYWTDPGKLQMQVDFLEEHEVYVGCAHNVKVVDENGATMDYISYITSCEDKVCTLCDIECGLTVGQTASLVYRNIFLTLSPQDAEIYYSCRSNGDRKLSALLVGASDVYYLGREMSAYRKVTCSGTSWSAQNNKKNMTYHYINSAFEIKKMMKLIYNVDLDMTFAYLSATRIAYSYCLLHPTRDNFVALYNAITRTGIKVSLIYLFKRTIIYYPMQFIHKIFR